MRSICVFCGSRPGTEVSYADAAMKAGGEVIGVMPKALVEREISHEGLTELHIVGSMHERKALMAGLSDGFVALPGGNGTLEEFFEVLTWAQLGEHRKPCGLLNVSSYYDPLLNLFDHMVEKGFLSEEHRAMVLVESSPAVLLDAFSRYAPPRVPKWIGSSET